VPATLQGRALEKQGDLLARASRSKAQTSPHSPAAPDTKDRSPPPGSPSAGHRRWPDHTGCTGRTPPHRTRKSPPRPTPAAACAPTDCSAPSPAAAWHPSATAARWAPRDPPAAPPPPSPAGSPPAPPSTGPTPPAVLQAAPPSVHECSSGHSTATWRSSPFAMTPMGSRLRHRTRVEADPLPDHCLADSPTTAADVRGQPPPTSRSWTTAALERRRPAFPACARGRAIGYTCACPVTSLGTKGVPPSPPHLRGGRSTPQPLPRRPYPHFDEAEVEVRCDLGQVDAPADVLEGVREHVR
jgi:hypothetical protein